MNNKKILNKMLIQQNQLVNCGRCNSKMPAYYVTSDYTKALYVSCRKCGNHARKFIFDLPIPNLPSKRYLREHKKSDDRATTFL